ncbi:MAG TPA: hypothetical protein VL727_07965 [Puia sp.]|nr:hypothetical protein [Puia sp.]
MFQRLLRSGFYIFITILLAASASAQHYIRVKPGRPAVAVRRPPPPYPNAFWVDEEWRWSNGRYVWSGGYWSRPPFRGARWLPGRWVNSRFGLQWVPGHWSRRAHRH